MADATRTVLIDFQVNSDELQSALDILVKTGAVDANLAASFKKSNAEISRQAQELKKTSAAAGTLTQATDKLTTENKDLASMLQKLFTDEFTTQLKDYGISLEDLQNKLRNNAPLEAADKQKSFREQLRALREEMVQVAQSEGVLSQRYLDLKEKAGQLDDTMKDVAKDISNAGSDTRTLDNVVGSVSAVAGAFSAAQGAAALFGNESEDVQKALLKVNAAMALSTGIQQILNATTKQGALTRLADAAATGLQTAAQRIYTFVTGQATAATLAFKVALAATGIGAAVVLLLALASAFKDEKDESEAATESINDHERAVEALNDALERSTEIQVAEAEKAGKAQSEITRLQGKRLQKQREILVQTNIDLALERLTVAETSEAWFKLNAAIEKNNEAIAGIDTQLIVTSLNFEKQLADERKKAAEEQEQKRKEQADKAREAAKKARAAEFEDFKAGQELQLLQTQKGSVEELEVKKKILKTELQIDLENENLTQNQRKLLIQKFFKERIDLQRNFDKQTITQTIEDEKNRLEATLQNVNISEEERLAVKTSFLELAASEEIQQAEGNAAKIKLINAKLRADIAAATVESIKQTAEQEIALTTAKGGAGRRALERVADDEKQKLQVRINAIRQIEVIETQEVDRRIQANRDADKVIGADHKALELEYEQLMDQKAKITEDTEKKITGLTKAENKKRQESTLAYVNTVISGLQAVGDIFGGIQQTQQQQTEDALAQRKKELDDLIAAGAITEKDAETRRKRIEADERAAKQRAAQQQKQLAVFNALLAIPQAYIAGLTAPFPVGGPIYGAILAGIAAAQAAIVASRPVPKFFIGKKGDFEGKAIVHRGELIERENNRLELVRNNEAITYLGSKDRVFTAGETRLKLQKIINNQMIKQPVVNKDIITPPGASVEIDYDKITKALLSGFKTKDTVINIDKEFISEAVNNGLMKTNYYDRYYSSK